MNDKCVVLNAKKMNFDGKLDFSVLSSDVTVYDDTTEQQLSERIQGADIIVTKEMPVSAEMIQKFPESVKLICEAGTGYNNIDLEAARKKGIHYVSLEELLKNSDYVSLHCPLTESTKHMINKESLSLMKPSAFIINTSRGALIDETALIEALENGTIAGAGLDVQETEPPEENSPLYTMAQVLLTPHMGWKGLETRQRLVSILADNIKQFMEGNPINVVSGL